MLERMMLLIAAAANVWAGASAPAEAAPPRQGGQAGPPAGQTAAVLRFGPSVEVTFQHRGHSGYSLDLDSAKMYAGGVAVGAEALTPNVDVWVRLTSMGMLGLVGRNMVVITGDAAQWDISPRDLVKRLSSQKPQAEAILSGGKPKPGEKPTYLFQTADGAMGVLQFVDFGPARRWRDIKARYRLLLGSAKGPEALSVKDVPRADLRRGAGFRMAVNVGFAVDLDTGTGYRPDGDWGAPFDILCGGAGLLQRGKGSRVRLLLISGDAGTARKQAVDAALRSLPQLRRSPAARVALPGGGFAAVLTDEGRLALLHVTVRRTSRTAVWWLAEMETETSATTRPATQPAGNAERRLRIGESPPPQQGFAQPHRAGLHRAGLCGNGAQPGRQRIARLDQ